MSFDASASHPLDASWLLRVNGGVYGPYTGHQLAIYVGEGRVTRTSEVTLTGEQNWHAAGNDPVLGDLFLSLRPAPPPGVSPPPRPATGPFANGLTTPEAMAHIVYGLYALGFFIGISWVVGAVIAHSKRDETDEHWLNSHFQWQIRTFWIGLAGVALSVPLMLVWVGFLLILVPTFWAVYRVVRGWLLLAEGKPIPDPTKLFS